MSVAQAMPAAARDGGSRWLLLGSLALNLFFVGVAVAMAVRAPQPPRWDPDVFVRVERLAAALPAADASIIRNAMQTNHEAVAQAQRTYQAAREDIHAALREDPFKVEALRAAMAKTRAARQNFDQVIQGVFADAVPQLSSPARHTLADWRNTGKRP
jgi:uncharacterized membrane protein